MITFDQATSGATIRFADDGSERIVDVPDTISVAVGMAVTVVDIPGDTPIYRWGS